MSNTYIGTTGINDQAGIWSAIVTIGGADWSARVLGDIRIDAEEGAARVADLSVRPLIETEFTIADWVGTAILIDIADMSTGSPASVSRLFTGVIDTPDLDLKSGIVSLRCTDDLQNVVDGMTVEAIDAAIPGGYASPVVFDPAARGWAHSQDRLSTLPAAMDFSPFKVLRVTNWEPKSTPDLTLTDDHIIDGSLSLSLSSRYQLINRVDIDFGFRFPRVKAEGYSLDFHYVDVSTFAAYVQAGGWWLQRQQVEAAIHGAGATILTISYDPLPTSAVDMGAAGIWGPGQYDSLLCMGFTATVSFNYTQTVEEQFSIVVSAPLSIAEVGTLRDRLSGALEGLYPPVQTAEHAMLMYANAISGIPPLDTATPAIGSTTSANVRLTNDTDRDAANDAMSALIQIAKIRIWGSHRRNTVSASVALNPAIDLNQTIDLDVPGVHACGKCQRVSHTLSPDTGAAISQFSLAICSISGTGISHPDTPTAAPAGSSPGTSTLSGLPTVVYHGGQLESHELVITFPGVTSEDRDRKVINFSSSYSAPLTEDIFTITI